MRHTHLAKQCMIRADLLHWSGCLPYDMEQTWRQDSWIDGSRKREKEEKAEKTCLVTSPTSKNQTNWFSSHRERKVKVERKAEWFIAKASRAGDRKNRGYIRPLNRSTLYSSQCVICYVNSNYSMCFRMCVLVGRREWGLLNFKFSTSVSQVITQTVANQRLVHCWPAPCYELMFMSWWWLSHGWRRRGEK